MCLIVPGSHHAPALNPTLIPAPSTPHPRTLPPTHHPLTLPPSLTPHSLSHYPLTQPLIHLSTNRSFHLLSPPLFLTNCSAHSAMQVTDRRESCAGPCFGEQWRPPDDTCSKNKPFGGDHAPQSQPDNARVLAGKAWLLLPPTPFPTPAVNLEQLICLRCLGQAGHRTFAFAVPWVRTLRNR